MVFWLQSVKNEFVPRDNTKKMRMSYLYTSIYHASGYVNNKIHEEAVKIDINAAEDIQYNKMIKHKWG